jgi:hypothetical protein
MASRKRIGIVSVVVLAAVCVVFTVLWQAGFVVADHTVVQGKGLVPVNPPGENQNGNTTGSNQSNVSLSNLIFWFVNQTKNIPGMEKLTMKVFYSNDSAVSVENQYNKLLRDRGYSEQPQYSSSFSRLGQTITYTTYTRGITGVVVFVSTFLGRTWAVYVTGNAFDLRDVYNYMLSHGYIQ